MKRWKFVVPLMFGTLVLVSGCVAVPGPPGLPPPPVPVVEFQEPVPYPGAVWVGGNWGWHGDRHRYEWHHGYWHH